MSRQFDIEKLVFKTTYLDYYKQVLRKVSFCNVLFRKEYKKARRLINAKERMTLDRWIKKNINNWPKAA